jgi:hypothetical protein
MFFLGFLHVFSLASRVAVAYGVVSNSEMYHDPRHGSNYATSYTKYQGPSSHPSSILTFCDAMRCVC